jgi:hypothetical protein
VALDSSAVREIVKRVSGRREVLAACQRRDLGEIIRVLGELGVTQGKIADQPGAAERVGGRQAGAQGDLDVRGFR